MLLPVAVAAQDNTWEQPEKSEKGNPDQKYMAGAVPVIDGRVVFKTTIKAPGKSKAQIYDILLAQMQKMTKEDNQLEQSRILLTDEENKSKIVANYQEWLVFKNKALNLDRTRLFFHLMVEARDGEADVTMTRIYYLYDEERNPTTYQAEEWITDRYGLNKKQTKLARVSGKFRRKTIDRKDYIFKKFETLLNQ